MRQGLSGNFDFIREWAPRPENTPPAENQLIPDSVGPSFEEALKGQLGLKLVKQTGTVKEYLLDHIEQPSSN